MKVKVLNKQIKILRILFLLGVFFILSACGEQSQKESNTEIMQEQKNQELADKGQTEMNTFKQITMEDAKKIFKESGDYIILDVRRADEFEEGHIPGAINVANESIITEMPSELPNKEQLIYVYCRSGNRSKQAAEKLVKIGYTNIVEFGGIIDWTGEVER